MDEKKTLEKLQRLCSRAEYCSRDVYLKAVKSLEGDAAAAERIVAALVKERYVDDLRYASAFAREKSSLQGWGEVKIRFQLRGKGIPEATITEALGEIDKDKAADKLARLLAEKYKTLQGDPQCKLKLIRFALGRGYGYDEVDPAVEETMNSNE